MTYIMQAYDNLLEDILVHGEDRQDRTGVGTLSRFGAQMRFDLRLAFPAVTKKHLNFEAVVEELKWFLRGSIDTRDLNSKIWDEWTDGNGEIGPMYGKQWRDWPHWQDNGYSGTDQIAKVLEGLRTDPTSRRHIVSTWNVADLEDMALAPCHVLFQFYVSQGKYLDCQLYQRSGDMFLGVPFNIASYALLTHAVAQETRLQPRYFVHTLGDAHIYKNHVAQVDRYLKNERLDSPTLILGQDILNALYLNNPPESIDITAYSPNTALAGYPDVEKIKAPVAV